MHRQASWQFTYSFTSKKCKWTSAYATLPTQQKSTLLSRVSTHTSVDCEISGRQPTQLEKEFPRIHNVLHSKKNDAQVNFPGSIYFFQSSKTAKRNFPGKLTGGLFGQLAAKLCDETTEAWGQTNGGRRPKSRWELEEVVSPLKWWVFPFKMMGFPKMMAILGINSLDFWIYIPYIENCPVQQQVPNI